LRARRRGQPLAEFPREGVQQGRVRFHIGVRVMGLRQQPRPLLEIQVLPALQTEGEKAIIRFQAVEVPDDILRPSANQRVATQGMRPQPAAGSVAQGKNLPAHRLVNGGVVVPE